MSENLPALATIQMPTLASIAKPGTLHRGEWEKLSRLCALIEKDGARYLSGSWKGRKFLERETLGGRVWKIRNEIEQYVERLFRQEKLDPDEWVVHAHLVPNREEPRAMRDWKVVLLCLREEPLEQAEVEHKPTISEKAKG